MLKPLALAVLFSATQSALAATWSYDFSGNLVDQFTQVADSPSPSTSGQVGGQFIYQTQNIQFTAVNPDTGLPEVADSNEVYVHNTFSPSFDQSWNMQIIATVPKSLDPTLPNQPSNSDWYMEIGLGAAFLNAQGDMYQMGNFLAIGNVQQPSVDRYYNAEYAITQVGGEWAEQLEGQGERNTLDETGMLGMSFNASTKVLSAYNSYETLLSLDLDAPGITNWGMAGSDHFIIHIGGAGMGWAIPAVTPLALDNFSATIQAVPEPETYAMMLAGLGLVGWVAKRRREVGIGDHSRTHF